MNKAPVLSAIVTGNYYTSGFVCIQDSLECSGRSLLQAFAQNAIDKQHSVHIFCFEHPVMKLKNSLQQSEHKHAYFHDCFSDPLDWMKGNVNNNSTSTLSITSILQNASIANGVPITIVVESLSSYVLNISFVQCYREFSKLLSSGIKEVEVKQIICLVHEDTMPNADTYLPQLAHLTTSYITVRAPTTFKMDAAASIIHKKPSGKVIKQMEEYSVTIENKVSSQIAKPNELLKSQQCQENANNLPDDLTTFRLSLGQQEKEARSQLVLPYIRKEKNIKEEAKGGGKVFYQLDAADDWDEEDPDDDLNI